MANSLNYSFKYNYDEAGKITSALVNRYTKKYPQGLDMENLFAYNPEGLLARISYDYNGNVDQTRQEYEYVGGNLVATKNLRGYKYDNNLLLANPFAFDVAMGIEAIKHLDDPFIYLPYMAGWHSFRSALLPSSIILQDQNPNAASPTYSSQIHYNFDVEGYVTSLSYNEDNGNGGFEEIIVKFGY